jgi:ATP-dependent DNA helicase RecG
MTRDELLARLKGYEWTDFECKKAQRGVPKDAYVSVSAFANTEGGWLLFGVFEENGQLKVGGVDPDAFDRVQNDFLSALRGGQKFNQMITVQPHVHELDGKRILAFHIPESPRHQKPVYLKGNPRDSYVRRAASDERVTDTELQRFLRDAATKNWDAEPLSEFDASACLDIETISWYQSQFYRRNPEQRQIDDPIEFLLEWNFISGAYGRHLLTRAAVLLFGTDRCVRGLLPRPVLDYQRIDTRHDLWSAEERWHDRVVFEENLFKTWRGLVAKYVRVAEHPFSLDPATLRRNDDPPDYVAFREAAINLLIHQDYGDMNRKASLKLFIDQTIFWNPGDAFASQRELFDSTEKEVRNPLLVSAFRRIGLSDQAGTGIRAIYRNWHELGHRPPQLTNDKAGKSFQLCLNKAPLITETMHRFQSGLGVHLSPEQADILALAAEQPHFSLIDAGMAVGGNSRLAREAIEHLLRQQLLRTLDSDDNYALAELIQARLEAQIDTTDTGQVEAHDEAHDEAHEPMNDIERRILERCSDQPKSTHNLLQALGYETRTGNFKRALARMLNVGCLEMTIPAKPRSKKQQYRLTDKGRRWLEDNDKSP